MREASYADWDFGLGVNLGGVVNGLQTFVPRIRAGGRGGHVVNTASLAGLVQMPSWMAIYATAKAAVIALSESIRDDLAQDDIGVTVLCPGPIKSRIHELEPQPAGPLRAQPGVQRRRRAARPAPGLATCGWSRTRSARWCVDAIRANRLYCITHGEWRDAVEARHQQILAAMPTEVDPELIASLMPKE